MFNTTCSVQEVTSVQQFMDLRDVWQQVLDKSQQHTPFLSHAWFQCCLEGYLGDKALLVLLVRDGSEVLGIAPWWQYREVVRGIAVRRLAFISSPDTPEVDFISQPGQREAVLETVLKHCFTRRRDAWDLLTLRQWPMASPHYSLWEQLVQRQRRAYARGITSHVLHLPIHLDWETYVHTRSVKFRKTYRNILNRVNKLDNVEVQCVRQDVTGEAFQAILAVSQRSWKFSEGIAIASRAETQRFFARLTEVASQQGWLYVWLLKVNALPIAMEYDLAYDGRVFALRADFDESYKELSPGAFLEYHIIKQLFDEGGCEYNLGPGLNAYKFHWTEQRKDNAFFSIYNSTLKGYMVSRLETQVIPFLKYVRDAIERRVSNTSRGK